MSWVQVTAANRSTVDLPGMCARFQWKAFGSRNGWGFGSAREAWYGQANKHPGELPPKGVDVPIWFSWSADPNWHAAVSLADGRLLMSPMTSKTSGQSVYPSLAAFIRAFPGMGYLGYAESMDGTRVVSKKVTPAVPTKKDEDIEMRTLYNIDNKNDDTCRATVGEFTFKVERAAVNTRTRKLWGAPVNVTQGEWDAEIAGVNQRRRMVGLEPIKGVPNEFYDPAAGDTR